jgi:hypothetical protein
MREIVFDIETTEFELGGGHRLRGFCAAKVTIGETMQDA